MISFIISSFLFIRTTSKDFDPDLYNSLIIYQVIVSSKDGDNSIGYGEGWWPNSHKVDLHGIINALDYIKGLNVNTILMTPVFDSSNNWRDRKLASTGYFLQMIISISILILVRMKYFENLFKKRMKKGST